MTALVKVLVRSKSDADAIKSSLRRFVGREVSVDTFKGARELRDVDLELRRHLSFKGLVVVMLGLEDRNALELEPSYPDNFVFHLVPKAKVRNERPHRLLQHYLEAKAEFRMRMAWRPELSAYTLTRDGLALEGWEVNPRFDVYLPSEGVVKSLKKLGVASPGLVVKQLRGLHAVYSGPWRVAELSFSDVGAHVEVERRSLRRTQVAGLDVHVEVNRGTISRLEQASLNYLSSFDVDHVVVPWSGGKDSTAALLLALKCFGKKTTPLFLDTGLEFRETVDYVEELSRKLGFSYDRVRVKVKEALMEGLKPLPSHDDRWCTAMKMEAVEGYVRELSKNGEALVVVGDREAESEARLMRPATMDHGGYLEAAPLKLWAAIHVQLYLALRGVPVNKMYEYGFFRVGCYICPALRSWELKLMLEEPRLSYLKDDELFQLFTSRRRATST